MWGENADRIKVNNEPQTDVQNGVIVNDDVNFIQTTSKTMLIYETDGGIIDKPDDVSLATGQ